MFPGMFPNSEEEFSSSIWWLRCGERCRRSTSPASWRQGRPCSGWGRRGPAAPGGCPPPRWRCPASAPPPTARSGSPSPTQWRFYEVKLKINQSFGSGSGIRYPGSGAFWPLDPEWKNNLDPGSGMDEGSVINITDQISKSLVTVFGLSKEELIKILKIHLFLAIDQPKTRQGEDNMFIRAL